MNIRITPSKGTALLGIAGVLAGCVRAVQNTRPDRYLLDNNANLDGWLLRYPRSFDLKIPADLEPRSCHTQGLAMTGSHIVISCTLYDETDPQNRAETARSFILKGLREAVVSDNPKADPQWQILEVPPHNKSEEMPVRLGHPSGMTRHPFFRELMFADSTYAPKGYSQLYLYDPITRALLQFLNPVPHHLSAVASLLGVRYVVGPTWDSEHFLVIDAKTNQWRAYPNSFAEHVDYQECESLNERTLLCTGELRTSHAYLGRADLIEISGDDLDTFSFHLKGRLHTSVNSGRSRPQENLGMSHPNDPLSSHSNIYGGHRTPRTLTAEGMAVDPKGKAVYFLPDDTPGGKLIRYEVVNPAQRRGK